MGVYNCPMFCCKLLCVGSSIAIILMGKRELIALLNLSSWCPVMVERLFLAVPQGFLRFVIAVFPDHTHLLFLICLFKKCTCSNINKVLELKEDRGLFARIVAMSRTNIHLQECLSTYELSIVPRSLFAADDTMLHCSVKSKFMDILDV